MRLRAAILVVAMLLSVAPAFSQSCAMCYGSAKATSKEGQRAINKGVIVLLIPPFAFMTLGIWMAVRYGNKRDLEQCDTLGMLEQPQLCDSFAEAPRGFSPRSSFL